MLEIVFFVCVCLRNYKKASSQIDWLLANSWKLFAWTKEDVSMVAFAASAEVRTKPLYT